MLPKENSRCKITGIEQGPNKRVTLLVSIQGIKNQLPIKYSPEELLTNDKALREFSEEDVRTITFYAIKNKNHTPLSKQPNYRIVKQEFFNNSTVYIIRDDHSNYEIRRAANELYTDLEELSRFSLPDVVNIVSTAVQEQLIEDLEQC
jgi:hypothetical protein